MLAVGEIQKNGLLINPHRSFHSGQYFAVAIDRLVATPRRCLEHIHLKSVKAALADQVVVKGGNHLPNERMIALALSVIFLAILRDRSSSDSCWRSPTAFSYFSSSCFCFAPLRAFPLTVMSLS